MFLASNDSPVAAVNALTVRYGPKTVLENLSLSIPEGCIGLLGPNGAGKSTLLKTMMGFLKPSGGDVHVMGKNVAAEPFWVRQRIGLMPEQDCHIPGMNAVTFVAYAGELAGMPSSAAMQRAHEVLEYCALGEARYRNVETYSTGMKQRIKLAQALVHGPRLLFLDEPTNGLDPKGRDEMLELVRDVSHGKGLSVVVSSHLLPDIERTCDAVIVMKGGQVVTQGPVNALRETVGVQMEVSLREFSPPFVASMARRGGEVSHQQGSELRFLFADVRSDDKDAPRRLARVIWEAAEESKAQVRGFRAAQRSLEDVFLEAVG